MIFKPYYYFETGCAAYLFGCGGLGKCAADLIRAACKEANAHGIIAGPSQSDYVSCRSCGHAVIPGGDAATERPDDTTRQQHQTSEHTDYQTPHVFIPPFAAQHNAEPRRCK